MTAPAVLHRPPVTGPRRPAPDPAPAGTTGTAAAAYQRVLHQLVRRELRLLADLAAWAPSAEVARTAELTRHADLVARVLLHHHAVERDRLWPALLAALPATERDAARHHVADWNGRTAQLDARLRDLCTLARQWSVSESRSARETFVEAGARLADAVDAQTEAEEATLLPLLGAFLHPSDWKRIVRAAGSPLDRREQLLVLGFALEDASALDRARLLAGLPPALRIAWRVYGRREHRAAVVRLRGAPPAG